MKQYFTHPVYSRRITYLLWGLFALFALLAAALRIFPDRLLNLMLLLHLQDLQHPALTAFMKAISAFPHPKAIAPEALLAAGGLWFAGKRREAKYVLLTAVPSVLNLLFKRLMDVPRPRADALEPLADASNRAFPSGHSLHSVLFFGFLTVLVLSAPGVPRWVKRLVLGLTLLLVVLIPFSRLYLGVHWLTDVIGGALLGLFFLLLLTRLYFRHKTRSEV